MIKICRFISLAFFVFSAAYAQNDIRIGESGVDIGIPLGTKIIDIGFANRDFINVSTISKADHLLLRWEKSNFDASVVGFEIRTGIPKCPITKKEFGLVPLDSTLKILPMSCMNFISPIDIGMKKNYVLTVKKFDYVVQVIGYDKKHDIVALSQIRYIKQRSK